MPFHEKLLVVLFMDNQHLLGHTHVLKAKMIDEKNGTCPKINNLN
jgi:hypothetical protein